MSHEFVMPGKVITGKGALQDAENEFQTAGKKALIVSGKVMERVGNVKVSSYTRRLQITLMIIN